MSNDTTTKILEIKLKYEDALANIAKYRKGVEEARQEQKNLNKALEEGTITEKQYGTQMEATRVAITQGNKAIAELSKEVNNQIKVDEQREGSLVSLRAELSNLTAAYDHLSREERNSSRGRELQDHINSVTNELKTAEEETQRYYRNVGNYKNAIIDAASANVPFVNSLKNMGAATSQVRDYFSGVVKEVRNIKIDFKEAQAATSGLSGVQKATAVTTNALSAALKLLKVALVSTGIGAIVVALGSLISYLSKTQQGVELSSKVMSSLGAAVSVVVDRLAEFGSAIVKLFAGDFKGAADSAKSAFSGIGDEIASETSQAWKLQDALNGIEKAEVMLSMQRASNKSQIADLKKLAEDTTKSEKERIEAAKEAVRLEQEDLQMQTKLAEARLANMMGYTEMTDEVRNTMTEIKNGALSADEAISRLGLSNSTLSDLREFRDLFNDIQGLNEQSANTQKELNNKINSIQKEGAAQAAQNAKDRASKELAAIREAEDAMLSLIKDATEKKRQQIQLSYDREIEDLRKRLDEEKNLTQAARDAINATVLAKQQQQANELAELDQSISDEAIKRQQENVALRLEAVRKGTEQEFALRQEQLQLKEEADLAAAEREIQNLEEQEQRKALIRASYEEQQRQLREEQEQTEYQRQLEAIQQRFEEQMQLAADNEQMQFEAKMQRLEEQREAINSLQEISEKERVQMLSDIQRQEEAVTKQHNDNLVKMEQAKDKAIASLMGTISDAIENLAGDNEAAAKLAKVIGMAELWINQAIAISEAIKTATKGDPYTVAARVAAAVASVVVGMVSAFSAMSKAHFATGGKVTGPGTGTSDSIPAQLSNGEFVVTAKATKIFEPLLLAMNGFAAGKNVALTGVGYQGAMSAQTSNDGIVSGLRDAFTSAMENMPNPVVSVIDINEGQSRVRNIDMLDTI